MTLFKRALSGDSEGIRRPKGLEKKNKLMLYDRRPWSGKSVTICGTPEIESETEISQATL
ncbi:MAG: hypothetical protein CSA34_01240 [Desulfobulbus propionicus]|nr:MAG: hypothetical protein CSA34_01240 [Desulfobulbus propionicus]